MSAGSRSVVVLPDHDTVLRDKRQFARAFMMAYREQDPIRGKPLLQKGPDGRFVLQNPPQMPLSEQEMDSLYAFPYTRTWHPMYDRVGGVPALAEVAFSITSHRGCFGGCTFCAIGFHQGRIIQARSQESILAEAEAMTRDPEFKGYIHDVGGPTANFRHPACKIQMEHGACAHRECMFPTPCKHLDTSHEEYLTLLRRVRKVTGVKKVFVRSGVRYDYALLDPSNEFIPELVKHHVSGQLKVAPEHVSAPVLACMGKPGQEVFDAFVRKYRKANEKAGLNQYLVSYFISGHPVPRSRMRWRWRCTSGVPAPCRSRCSSSFPFPARWRARCGGPATTPGHWNRCMCRGRTGNRPCSGHCCNTTTPEIAPWGWRRCAPPGAPT